MSALDALGMRHGTDKCRVMNDYLRHYEPLFRPLRNTGFTLIEIGVHRGSSLRVWREYFSQAEIVGIDVESTTRQFAPEGVAIEIGSQYDAEFLAYIAGKYAPGIVIDDGSHVPEHQIFSFEHLFGAVQPGGLYIVEDVRPADDKALDYFLNLARGRIWKGAKTEVASVEIIAGAVILKKRRRDALDGRIGQIRKRLVRTDETLLYLSHYIEAEGGTREDALAAALEAAELEPRNPWVHHRCATLYRALRQPEKALQHARKAEAVCLGDPDHFTQARIKLEREIRAQARVDARRR